MPHLNAGKHVQEYVYDFAVDGGVKDVAINLHAKDNKGVIPVGAIITDVTAKVVTAIVGSSSTVAWGNGDDSNLSIGEGSDALRIALRTYHADILSVPDSRQPLRSVR